MHEYAQFASIIKKLLAYRHQKHVQCEMTQDGLENKRDQLEELEKSEREARRLDEALGRGRFNGPSGSSQIAPPPGGEQDGPDHSEPSTPNSGHLPPHPGPSPVRRRTRAPGMGLLNALSYTLHGMMDVDPETARRNGITKTREGISQVCTWLSLIQILILTPRETSLKTACTWQHKTSNTRVRRSRRTWTGSRDRRWLISGK